MNEILHILDATAWSDARTAGHITSPSLVSEGFVHCSTRAQVAGVIERFYADVPDLLIASIDGDLLEATLRWEPPAHPDGSAPADAEASQLFPHVYGQIPLAAVVRITPWQEFS